MTSTLRSFRAAPALALPRMTKGGRKTQARFFALSYLAVPLLLLAAGCGENSGGLTTIPVTIGSKPFHLEVAKTAPELEKGLMSRDSMPADHGMLFVFKEESVLSFWMKNTRFDLDIIYLDRADKVVSIHQMKSYDLAPISSDYPAQFAIELNLGAAADAGVHVGDVVAIPKSAAAP